MSPIDWTQQNIPDQTGRSILITGANSGTGFEAARLLAARGAHIVMACRSLERGEPAVAAIRDETPSASLDLRQLDLADLDNIRAFAEAFLADYEALPALVNNAGVMALPYRKSPNGHEMHLATNHLGHFALTGRLLPALLAAPGARVVTVSSGMHERGQMNFDDLHGREEYSRWSAYSQSKLANLLFAYELQRRFEAGEHDAISVGVHPGYAATNLQYAGPEMEGSLLRKGVMKVANTLFAQSATMGALPLVYAAAAPDVQGGSYIGPDGFNGMRGYPTEARSSAESRDEAAAARLWALSEQMTGLTYDRLMAPVS